MGEAPWGEVLLRCGALGPEWIVQLLGSGLGSSLLGGVISATGQAAAAAEAVVSDACGGDSPLEHCLEVWLGGLNFIM